MGGDGVGGFLRTQEGVCLQEIGARRGGRLTWSRSITEDLMISLHFWSSVSWYFCWDSKSWAHSV